MPSWRASLAAGDGPRAQAPRVWPCHDGAIVPRHGSAPPAARRAAGGCERRHASAGLLAKTGPRRLQM